MHSASLPWDIRKLCARYLRSLRHVSASCLLSEREERQLISDAMEFEDMRRVVCNIAEQYDKEVLKGWCRCYNVQVHIYTCAYIHRHIHTWEHSAIERYTQTCSEIGAFDILQ
jgi:hypothetical protein